MKPSERIIVALDTTDPEGAVSMAEMLAGLVGGLKLGKEFFTANGPGAVGRISQFGLPLFLDLKFHDIPTTVAAAVRAALPLKPHMINVHASGGAAMMKAAAAAAAEAGEERPLVLGVTVLTSLGEMDLAAMGVGGLVRDQVLRLARLAKDCGLDGVVCSAAEVVTLRGACGTDFKLVVPGIRPVWATKDDHKRVLTPADAVALGADFLVIGRPITGADDPAVAARRIAEEIADSLPVLEVKICGLATREAVDVAVDAGARYVGFVFFPPSPRSLEPVQAASLTATVPASVTRVGLFVDADDDDLGVVLARVPLDMLQFHGAEPPERIAEVKRRWGMPVMKALPVARPEDLAQVRRYEGVADRLLFDARPPEGADRPGGNARSFDWTVLKGFDTTLPWMLAGGITMENVANATRLSGATAVDVSSGVEDAPGVKNPDKIKAFLGLAATI